MYYIVFESQDKFFKGKYTVSDKDGLQNINAKILKIKLDRNCDCKYEVLTSNEFCDDVRLYTHERVEF